MILFRFFYTDEVLKWDKKSQKNQQRLTVSGRVNFGFDVSCNTPDEFKRCVIVIPTAFLEHRSTTTSSKSL